METARIYLEKHAAGDPLIKASPEKGLKYIVVIPSYLETRLTESLVSLFEADLPPHPVEVIIIINWPENENPENIRLSREAFISASKWAKAKSTNKLRFHTIEAGFFPVKKAGVGYARKTGMDEAVRRFIQAGQEDGIIISFDADSKCEKNYFTAIDAHFSINNQTDGCSVYFEHELAGDEFPEIVYEAITQYELHMRTYLHGVRYTGFPNAFYTVGSSMVVRASSYCRQGGMNVRKAGEDFYFLQKFFDLGRFTDLKETIVYPSPRPSLRVPFGTGKAITERIKETTSMKSYNPATYDVLRHFFSAHKELNTDRKMQAGPNNIRGVIHVLQEFL
ncbi:MAG: glycosyltransferase family 2 protein [Bacteroidales bacterium]|nr:glycosyltransferase family 2 protein [Bacteroidales bacterium]